MISSYRLGDLILLDNLNSNEIEKLLKEHPDSFGSKYILEKKNNNNCSNCSNIDIITKIVMEYIDKNIELLPKDISESIVIHLRLGDAVGGNEWYELAKRPLSIDYLKQSLDQNNQNNRKKYVIGKCHFGTPGSPNIEESIILSNKYLKDVINEFEAEHFNSGNADLDLCCAVKSKLFIQGKGYYSQLIVDIRNKLNLESITTETNDTRHFPKVEHFNSGNTDLDLYCAEKSKLFIQDKSYYNQLIVDIKNKLNLESITTETNDKDIYYKKNNFFILD